MKLAESLIAKLSEDVESIKRAYEAAKEVADRDYDTWRECLQRARDAFDADNEYDGWEESYFPDPERAAKIDPKMVPYAKKVEAAAKKRDASEEKASKLKDQLEKAKK
jgi:hypothetical protein